MSPHQTYTRIMYTTVMPTQPPLQPLLSSTMIKLTASSVLSTPDTLSKASPSSPSVTTGGERISMVGFHCLFSFSLIAKSTSFPGTDSTVLGAISGAALLLLVFIASITAILLCLRRLRRRRKTPQLTDNVAYNIHDHDIKTDTNEAYGTVDSNDVLATATNPAYVTTVSGGRDIHTATNEAYISTDFSTSDNPPYVPVEENRSSTLVYDYVATQGQQ